MDLLLDIGNTKITTFIKKSVDKYDSYLIDNDKTKNVVRELEKLIFDKEINNCFISSVVPEVNEEITNYLKQKQINVRLLEVTDYHKLIDVGDLDYSSMGADRVVVDYAALSKYGENVIVFDLGTAMTVDVLKEGQYKTGYIFPGLRLIRDSLTGGTSQLKDFDFFELENRNVAVNTLTQLNDGIMYGLLGVINQYIKIGKSHFETIEPKVILTGGSMYNILKIITLEELIKILEANVFVDLKLMVEGLIKISVKLKEE